MKTIKLKTKEELNIYMNPVRQQLLRQLNISGIPMTPKMLTNHLQISASSVQHHIKKLVSLGLIELDHTELIKGITARFYVPTQVTVQIGLDKTDDLNRQREVLMQESIARIYENYHKQLRKRLNNLRETNKNLYLAKQKIEQESGTKNENEIGNEKEILEEKLGSNKEIRNAEEIVKETVNETGKETRKEIGKKIEKEVEKEIEKEVEKEIEKEIEKEKELDIEKLMGSEKAKELVNSFGDIMTGVIHLNDADSNELMNIISNYIETRSKPTKNSTPWEYALILYNAKEDIND
jgi:predicted transcriptional regulator